MIQNYVFMRVSVFSFSLSLSLYLPLSFFFVFCQHLLHYLAPSSFFPPLLSVFALTLSSALSFCRPIFSLSLSLFSLCEYTFKDILKNKYVVGLAPGPPFSLQTFEWVNSRFTSKTTSWGNVFQSKNELVQGLGIQQQFGAKSHSFLTCLNKCP